MVGWGREISTKYQTGMRMGWEVVPLIIWYDSIPVFDFYIGIEIVLFGYFLIRNAPVFKISIQMLSFGESVSKHGHFSDVGME